MGGGRWGGQRRQCRGPLVEDAIDGSSEEDEGEEIMTSDRPTNRRGRVLRRAAFGEPVCPGQAAQLRLAQGASARQTRVAVTRKVVEAVAARRKASASSSSRRSQMPPPSPPPTDVGTGFAFDFGPLILERDFGPLSPKSKRKATKEEEEENEE